MSGPLIPSFQSHVICLSPSEAQDKEGIRSRPFSLLLDVRQVRCIIRALKWGDQGPLPWICVLGSGGDWSPQFKVMWSALNWYYVVRVSGVPSHEGTSPFLTCSLEGTPIPSFKSYVICIELILCCEGIRCPLPWGDHSPLPIHSWERTPDPLISKSCDLFEIRGPVPSRARYTRSFRKCGSSDVPQVLDFLFLMSTTIWREF